MKINNSILSLAKNKALKSMCRYKISAIGLNHKGEVIYTATNRPRFVRKGGGIHAEMNCMLCAGPSLKSILICRVNSKGGLCRIDPCKMCEEKAREKRIRIYSILDRNSALA